MIWIKARALPRAQRDEARIWIARRRGSAEMIGISTGTDAWGLTKAMARRVGVDLPAAIVEGWLTRPEVQHLVCACERCGLTPLCADWLAVPRQPDLPAYCRNKDEIEALA